MKKTLFKGWVTGLILLAVIMAQVAVVILAQSGPPPLPGAEQPQPNPNITPGIVGAPQPIPSRDMRAMLPPPPMSSPIPSAPPVPQMPDGPFAPAGSVGHDNMIASTGTTIAVRTTTAWLAGPTTRAGEAQANALGSTFTIPLYSQEGRITEMLMATFMWEGKTHQTILDNKVTATLYRFYRLDGTNLVLLPEVVTNKVNNLP